MVKAKWLSAHALRPAPGIPRKKQPPSQKELCNGGRETGNQRWLPVKSRNMVAAEAVLPRAVSV